MKKLSLFLPIFILCFGCEKRKTNNIIQDNIDNFTATAPVLMTVDNENKEILSMMEESKTLQEIIIENYEFIVVRYSHKKLSFQIEGNFTGSGNKESIGFYENTYDIHPRLSAARCFVSDTSGKNIEKIFEIDWRGIDLFNEEFEANSGLTVIEALGKVYYLEKPENRLCKRF
jgi:hypothetical protein